MVGHGKTTWVILNLIAVTYINSGIILTLKMEDKTPSLVASVMSWIRVSSKTKHEDMGILSKIL